MNKNELYELTIEDIGTDGEGIGHIPDVKQENSGRISASDAEETGKDNRGIAVFVKDTVVGDHILVRILKVKKNYAFGRLEKLLEPSPYRVEARCSKARSCGGCTLMHMSYEKQLEYKRNKVKSCLERIGGLTDVESYMEPICGMEDPFSFRNKMQFPVGLDKEGRVKIGFYAGRTHTIIDLERCEIGHPVNNMILAKIRPWLQKWQNRTGSFIYQEETHTGLIRHILTRVGFSTGEVMVCLVINGKELPAGSADELEKLLSRAVWEYNTACEQGADNKKYTLKTLVLNINREKTNRILGDSCVTLMGEGYITDYIGNVSFRISPMSFYQVNPVQTKVLYDKAVEYAGLTGEEVVWDMYCGIGTISLCLAQKAKKVYGVEIIPQAIEDAKQNAEINGLTNTEFYCGKAEEVVPAFYQDKNKVSDAGNHPDVIVVDPPRKGCDEVLLATIVQMNPKRVVYVSCDPATLARDLKYMAASGYQVQKVGVVDQFCHSGHIETVVKLSLKTDTPKFEVIMEPDEEHYYTPEEKVTYQKIKEYVFEKYGLKVHSLYIAQIKDKCGLDKERKGNNWKKNEDARVPQCTMEKEAAIMDAFMHFGMI